MKAGSAVSLQKVTVVLGGQEIVSAFDLEIAAGEFICLLGPSGCGKSTVLNAIAGFQPVEGELTVAGAGVQGPGSERGVVFQSSEALFPWLTLRENIGYGLRVRGVGKDEISERVDAFMTMVGLSHSADKFPDELSGGMRQRAQIARVLINKPSVVLMDEPFGALDAQTRETLQRELDGIWRATGCTVIFVTHDIWEAILLADRIVMMTPGPRASVKTVEAVDLPRPRDPLDPATLSLYGRLRSELTSGVGTASSRASQPATPVARIA
ncbi:MAG: ABC transporter ATP-binding protein [Rhizobiaceae bacterium]